MVIFGVVILVVLVAAAVIFAVSEAIRSAGAYMSAMMD